MNILFFLSPKQDLMYVYDDFTLRQTLEKWENNRYASIPVLNRKGEYVGTLTEGDILWGLKKFHGLDLEAAEDIPIRDFAHKRDYNAVTVTTSMDQLIEAAMKELIHRAREGYDYILMDSPAGLGEGFRLACCAADRAMVVSTTDASALRDAQRTVSVLRNRIPRIHLVVNRVQPRLLRRLHTTIDDAMDAAGLPLLGIVPEDPQVMLCANQGQPLILRASRGAAVAYLNIAKRLLGQKAPLMKIR